MSDWIEKEIDTASNGPVTLIEGSPDQTIVIFGIFLTASIDTTFKLLGDTNELFGLVNLNQAGVFCPDRDDHPWFTLKRGESLKLIQTASAQISGRVYYAIRS